MDEESIKNEIKNLVQEYNHCLKELSVQGYKSEISRSNFFLWLIAKKIGSISRAEVNVK